MTASILYDLLACPHRVTLDAFGDSAERDEITPFVRLLWQRGSAYEREVMSKLAGTTPVLDLSAFPSDEREPRTTEALQQRVPLIYQGRIRAGDLLGIPDLLRLEGDKYAPIDIKSGRGEEGSDDDTEPTPKTHYAVQLALYVDILEQLGLSAGRHAYVWDIQGNEVLYDLSALYGKRSPRTLWNDYEDALAEARTILARTSATRPAYTSSCKLCHWRSHCLEVMEKADDITLMAKLGRSLQDVVSAQIPTMTDMATIDPEQFIQGKKTVFAGVGPDRLRTFCERARLIKSEDPAPRLVNAVTLPVSKLEIFFDVETDPMQDICYLHGFVERRNGDNATQRFVSFFADEVTREAEEAAFRAAWAYLSAHPDAIIYYYSKYERTTYRKLQERYPSVCSADDIEALFALERAVDLYFDVVEPATLWPTRDHSIKTLAKHLGFAWRDTDPSGSASIEWYQRYCKSRDPDIKTRILDYNEDDCRATRVLLDGIRTLA
jgi:predicted RecB family nuclease